MQVEVVEGIRVLAGFAVGLLVGLTGVGGGALMTPVLVLLLGIAPMTAVGTDLWFATLTKGVGGTLHGRRGTVDWVVVGCLWCGSLPASALTLWWLRGRGDIHRLDQTIVVVMGVVLMATAGAMLFRPQLQRWLSRHREDTPPLQAPTGHLGAATLPTVVAGAMLGWLVTLTSIGAGALGAVLLVLLHPRRLTPRRLVGTDIVHAVPLTLLAGAGYLSMGAVEVGQLGWLLLGSVPGVVLGAVVSTRTAESLLRRLVALVLAIVGAQLIFKA